MLTLLAEFAKDVEPGVSEAELPINSYPRLRSYECDSCQEYGEQEYGGQDTEPQPGTERGHRVAPGEQVLVRFPDVHVVSEAKQCKLQGKYHSELIYLYFPSSFHQTVVVSAL